MQVRGSLPGPLEAAGGAPCGGPRCCRPEREMAFLGEGGGHKNQPASKWPSRRSGGRAAQSPPRAAAVKQAQITARAPLRNSLFMARRHALSRHPACGEEEGAGTACGGAPRRLRLFRRSGTFSAGAKLPKGWEGFCLGAFSNCNFAQG